MKRLLLCIPLALLGCKPPATTDSAPAAHAASKPALAAKPASKAKPAPKAVLAAGDPAPQLSLTLQDGAQFALAEHQDAFVFVYFYPKDDTPGCTVEAQGLRDNYEALTTAGVTVIGVSMQDATSHKAFIDAHKLPFSLAVDDGAVAKAFDVPVRGEYASRHSFLLKGGKVVEAWRSVDPAKHASEVLAAAVR